MYWDGELDSDDVLSENSAISYGPGGAPKNVLPVTPGGLKYDPTSADSYVNAYNQEKAYERDDRIRWEKYAREDNAYANLFNQLQGLGVNPALLLSSVGPTVGSAGDTSASSFKTSNTSVTSKTEAANSAKVFGNIVAALAMIAAAIIAA